MILWFLGRGFQAAAALDDNVKSEVSKWDRKSKILFKVESFGPCLVMGFEGDKFKSMGLKECDSNFTIYFKNIEAAILVLTGSMGIDKAYAQHRVGMKGDIIALGMPLVRCLYIVEAYLFPDFIGKRIFKRMPVRQRTKFRIYSKVIFGI